MKRSNIRRSQKPLKKTSSLKRGKSPLKNKSRLKPVSKDKYTTQQKSWGFNNQVELFEFIIDINTDKEGNVYSEISGKKLNGYLNNKDIRYCCCMHVLDKKNYPKYVLNDFNMMLGTPYEHSLIDQGTHEQRDRYEAENSSADFSRFYDKQKELKKEYENS